LKHRINYTQPGPLSHNALTSFLVVRPLKIRALSAHRAISVPFTLHYIEKTVKHCPLLRSKLVSMFARGLESYLTSYPWLKLGDHGHGVSERGSHVLKRCAVADQCDEFCALQVPITSASSRSCRPFTHFA
jgi:hypothetical protein